MTDGRGAVAAYAYNRRHLVTSVAYAEPAGVAETPGVSYEYDAAGNRTRMEDGQGWAAYAFDALSRIESETRHVSALGRSYTLSYTYTLAGQVKSVNDQAFATRVDYGYDDAGRLAGVAGAGYPRQVTRFASGIRYRAWGGPKELTYGNGFRFTAAYTARMQVRRAELRGAGSWGNSTVMGAENQYDEDGRLRFSTDLRPDPERKFDRRFEYDVVGRLKEAYSGAEARGEAVDREFVPLRQSYGYGEFDNLTSRANWHWERFKSFTDTYADDRRQTPAGGRAWEYDEDGNLLSDLKRRYRVDAAGRVAESSGGGAAITQGFDGDGRLLAHTEALSSPAATTHSYSIRSAALGGVVVAEVDGAGARRRGFVYAGGELLARVEGGEVRWEHRQPATGGRWESTAAGQARALTELDPLGADVGTESPYEPGVTPAEPVIFDAGSHWGSRAGSASDPQSGCNATGLPLPCELVARMLRDGSARIEEGHRDRTPPPGFGVIPWVPSGSEPGEDLRSEVGRRHLDYTSVMSPNSSLFTAPQNPTQLTSTEINKLGSNLQKLLDDSECGKYIKAMLDSLPADINGTTRSSGSLMDAFNRIKDGGGFWSKDTGPKVAAMINPATLTMTFNSQRSTPLISSDRGWQQLGVTLTLVHELTHVFTSDSKISGYSHLEMGRAASVAASRLGINIKATLGIKLPTVRVWDEATDQAFSDYYGRVLAYACRKAKL